MMFHLEGDGVSYICEIGCFHSKYFNHVRDVGKN